MNAVTVFLRMLVLFGMMLVGYFCYKKGMLNKDTCQGLSKLVVNIMNPLLVIDGVIGKNTGGATEQLLQNLLLVCIYFTVLIVLSIPVSKLLRVPGNEEYLYRLMLIFSNVGFMGIPVITGLYGKEAMVYIVFYMMLYNILLYTYGIHIVSCSVKAANGTGDGTDVSSDSSGKTSGRLRIPRFLNIGVISCIIAVLIFVFRIDVPQCAADFINMTGQSAVPLSMILIGASMAQRDLKKIIMDKKIYLFLGIRLLLIPITAALVIRNLPVERMMAGVFGLMLAMPVGSIVVLIASEQGADETVCTRGSVISTLLSVITIPVVAAFLP